MKVYYKEVKTILNKSKIDGVEYTLNPYIGCEHNCKYCYATYMSTFVNEKNEDWGKFVYVKKNAKEILQKDLRKLIKKGEKPAIMLASATDAWQSIEKTEEITRGILETFISNDFDGILSCLTKNSLIYRDIDLFKQIKNVVVGMSITGIDDKISLFFEPNASPISERFKTLEKVNKEGIKTVVFIAPVLPYYFNHLNELEELFKRIKSIGTNYIIYDLLNFYGNILSRFKEYFKDSKKGRELYIDLAQDINYQRKMESILNELMYKYDFKYLDRRSKEFFDRKKGLFEC